MGGTGDRGGANEADEEQVRRRSGNHHRKLQKAIKCAKKRSHYDNLTPFHTCEAVHASSLYFQTLVAFPFTPTL